MFKRKDSSRLESEIATLKRENETLKRENAELRHRLTVADKLKESLDEVVRHARPKSQPALRGQRRKNSQPEASSAETTDSELRKLIRDLQDRVSVAEQVTAATQRRQQAQGDAYEIVPTNSDYEDLRISPPEQCHVYAELQLTTHRGCILVLL